MSFLWGLLFVQKYYFYRKLYCSGRGIKLNDDFIILRVSRTIMNKTLTSTNAYFDYNVLNTLSTNANFLFHFGGEIFL